MLSLLKNYEKEIHKQHNDTIKQERKTTSSFTNLDDVPFYRFDDINTKLKSFPLLQKADNCFLYDFNDGLGKVYAYHWKNDKSQGIVSYWMQFDDDKNIDIDKESTVSSCCKLFAKNGKISLKRSKVINCELWAINNIELNLSDIKDSFIYGSINLKQASIKDKTRFYTKDCVIKNTVINNNNLFYQDDNYNGSISIDKCEISGSNEFIGGVSLNKTTITGQNKVAGDVIIDESTISDTVYIDAGVNGSINIKKGELSGNTTIINNVTINEATCSDSCFLCDNAILIQSSISDNAILANNAKLISSSMSGNAICNMDATVNQSSLSGNGMATGSSTVMQSSISDYGIISGKGTSITGGSISGHGRVFDGVACTHGVSGEHRHWDKRSCEKQIDTLKDERYFNTPGSPSIEQPPPTIN